MKLLLLKLLIMTVALFVQIPHSVATTLEPTDSVEQVATMTPKVDINSAGIQQLTSLPGIGEKKAAAIVDYRDKQGPFTSIEELVNVKGIGDKLLAKLASSIAVK